MKKILVVLLIAALAIPFAFSAFAATGYDSLEAAAPGRNTLIGKVLIDTVEDSGAWNAETENGAQMFDNDTATKFGTGVIPATVTWQMDKAYVVDAVAFATANDNAKYTGRIPATWILSGSTDGKTYTKIHEGTSDDFDDLDFTYFFVEFKNDKAYAYYQLEIPEAMTNGVQLSELVLCSGKTGTETPKTEEPKTEEPKAEAPKAEEVKTEAPKTVAAPATADFFAISALALLASGAALVASKKRK